MDIFDYFTIWHRIVRGKPIGFSIDVTNQCNLSCRTCYMKWYSSKRELSVKEWERILTSFPPNNRFYGAWTGGEPPKVLHHSDRQDQVEEEPQDSHLFVGDLGVLGRQTQRGDRSESR